MLGRPKIVKGRVLFGVSTFDYIKFDMGECIFYILKPRSFAALRAALLFKYFNWIGPPCVFSKTVHYDWFSLSCSSYHVFTTCLFTPGWKFQCGVTIPCETVCYDWSKPWGLHVSCILIGTQLRICGVQIWQCNWSTLRTVIMPSNRKSPLVATQFCRSWGSWNSLR